ncbi:MAG: hypothetical protein CMA67_04795 [Euryarchaeota archaeon]|nr:hypothetical protein [Euryarchaeota archaeon]
MRNLIIWIIIAALATQVTVNTIDLSNESIEPNFVDDQESLQTSARDSHQMAGSDDGGNPNCNFTNMADGMGGPVWESTGSYNMHDIVEWPANSGHFWQTTTAGPTGEPSEAGKWIGPCSCEEIAEASGITWDSTSAYDPWQILEYNGGIWFVQDAGTTAGDIPQEGSDIWTLCEDSCASLVGVSTPVWENSTLVSQGDVYEYPANSGHYYAIVGVGMTNQTVGAPGEDLDAWGDPLDCDCKEIWEDSGEPVWDSQITYAVNAAVEHPSGSGDIWIAIAPSTTAGVEPGEPWADGNQWELCESGGMTTGGPCGGMNFVGVWDTLSRVSTGEIYEYPAGSQTYYEVIIQGYVDQEVSSPTIDLDVWAEVDCPCQETWETNGEPVWDSTVTYSANDVVEWPAGSMMLYIALPSPGPGDEPGVDPEWELCSAPDEPSGGPCDGLNVPVWDNTTTPVVGDIYEYPANSESYYEIIFVHDDPNGGPGYINFPAENGADEFWKPYDCPCKETWVASGEPVWDSSTIYYENDVVEHPANSGTLWIALDNGFNGSEPSLTALDWKLCSDSDMPSSNPCAGLDVLGVWDNSNVPVVGDVYEYPANSEDYWEIIHDHGGNITEPGSNGAEEFWVPVDCPCKETWVANGQPVWVSGTAYPGNYVVEHPAGSGNLYIPLESGGVTTGAGEPGVDIHWVLCNGNGPSPGPCEGLDVPVWDNTTTPVVGDIYEYPANSGIYHEIIFIHDDAYGGPDWVADPIMDGGADEFWKPYSCPCKETWVANGEPVWDNTSTFYPGNYVVEWPAGSGALYISEGGGLTGVIEPGTDDGHWIPCDGNPEAEAEPEEDDDDDDSIPSIGFVFTVLGVLLASTFVRRTMDEE